jgi:uncharacterized protein (TIGR03435 family)
MSNFQRRVYGAIVRLHPADFRNEFGCEMALDFEEVLESNGFVALYFDALLSLGRQWAACVFPETTSQDSIAGQSLLAGQYVMISRGCLTFFDLARASVLSLMLFLLIGFAMTTSNSRTVGIQAGHQDHQRAHNGLEDHARGEGKGDRSSGRELIPAPNYDLARDNTAAAAGYFRRALPSIDDLPDRGWRTKHSSSTEPTVEDHLWQAIAFAVMALLTMLLLRRRPSMGRKMVLGAFSFLVFAAPVALPLYGQILHASEPLPSFEVATIRPWEPPPLPIGQVLPMKVSPGSLRGQMSDRVHFIGQAAILIGSAYNLQPGHEDHILGGPDWVQQQAHRYQIQAKIEESLYAAMQKMTPAQQREQVDLMEQSLLADRFKLKVHFETREMPVYALVVAKGGPKLTPAKDGEPSRLFNTAETERGIETAATAITLDELVHSPLLFGGRDVIDKTGLKGAYDFTLKWGREQPIVSDAGQEGGADAPLLFTAIQEQLGLRLVRSKGPVEVIVVDHIEQPSAN